MCRLWSTLLQQTLLLLPPGLFNLSSECLNWAQIVRFRYIAACLELIPFPEICFSLLHKWFLHYALLSSLQEWPPAQIMLYRLAPMMVLTVLLSRINLTEGISTWCGTRYCVGYVRYPVQSQRSTRLSKPQKNCTIVLPALNIHKVFHVKNNPLHNRLMDA